MAAGDVEALPSSSCTGLEFEGEGDPDYLLASDFPLQGSSRTQTEQIVAAIRHELEQRDWKAGDYNIGVPVVRRRDRPGREVGLGQVLAERQRVCGQRRGDRGHRDVQLGMRADHHPAAERRT